MERASGRDPAPVFTLLLAYATGLSLIALLYYGDLLSALRSTLASEEYSYLAVVFAGIVASAALALPSTGVTRSLPPSRLLAGLGLVSAALLLYSVSMFQQDYMVQLKTLSLVMVSWALLLTFIAPIRAAAVVPVLSLALLVPLPRSLVDALSLRLSRAAGWLTASITGAGYGVSPQGAYLTVETPHGVVTFEVAAACSGVASLFATLAVTPLAAYRAASSSGSVARRLGALGLAVALASATAFAGNVARLTLMVVAAERTGVGAALTFFHYTPSPLYTAAAVALAVIVLDRLLEPSGHDGSVGPAPWPRGALLLLAAALTSVALLYGWVHVGPAAGGGPVLDYGSLVANATAIFEGTGIRVVSEAAAPRLGLLLGEPSARSIAVEYGSTVLQGYLEVAESPTRFHNWVVCLTGQGYRVERGESYYLNGTVARTLYFAKDGVQGLLAYAVYTVPASFGGRVEPVYVRLTLIYTTSGDPAEQLPTVLSVLEALATRLNGMGYQEIETLKRATMIASGVITASLAYVAASLAYRVRLNRER